MAKKSQTRAAEKRDRWAKFDLAELTRLRGELAELNRETQGFVNAAEKVQFSGVLEVDGGEKVYEALQVLVVWLRRSQEAYDSQRIAQRSVSSNHVSRKLPSTSTP